MKEQGKETPRPFKFVKDLCEAHNIKKKELGRYYRKCIGGQKPENLFSEISRGRNKEVAGHPKIKRNIINVYMRFGSNRYELVLLFKPYYLDRTPSPGTMDRIKARYPLNKSAKRVIKSYEKQVLGDLAQNDTNNMTKDIRCTFKRCKIFKSLLFVMTVPPYIF